MPETPLLDRMELERSTGYEPPIPPADLPNVPFRHLETPSPSFGGGDDKYVSPLNALENSVLSIRGDGKMRGGSVPRSIAESISPRYNMFVPGDYDNEDAYAQGQGWTSKMVNGVGKGLVLTGTTLLQSTAGLLNGLVRAAADGRAASFYDNEFNRNVDEINKKMEDLLPNYYTNVEREAAWYSKNKLFTANFFWDGIIKNMGFAAGAALSGGIYSGMLKALPLTARLFSVGKAAEALAATEEGLLGANKVAETFGKIKSLSDRFTSSYKTLNAGGRALVAGLATTGEAGFEAYHNMHQFRDEKIREYKEANNGQEPTGEVLAAINAEAENVGNSSFLLNTALLSATNYIQFPKILGSSYKAEKNVINGLTKEIGETVTDAAGNIIAKAPKTGFGKLLSVANKIRPYTFSTSEAFEEGAQFAIGVGTQDYYNKKYKEDPSAVFLTSAFEGIRKTLGTDEGMENVLIGGISGSLMQARGTFREQREKSKNTAQAIAKFNKFKLSDFTKETVDSVNRGVVLQQEREQALKQGDVLESKDKETDYVINYLSPRIKYGRMDLVESDIQTLRELASSDDGFAQLISEGKALAGDTQQAFLQRLAGLENTAGNIKSLYESLNIRYGGMIGKDGKPIYSSDVMDKMVYAATKIADYDTRIPNVSATLLPTGIDTSSIVEDVAKGNFESYDKAVETIEGMKDKLTSDQILDFKQSLQDIAELTLRRQKFLKEYNEIKQNPNNFKESIETPEVAPEEEGKEKPTFKVTTKDGEKELSVGEEYFLGKGVDYDKDGLEKPINISRFTILQENEDGTIKILTNTGEERDVSKDVLADYKLGKVSTLEANKTAKYFYNHRNDVFEYNFGEKYGGKKPGRLEYEDGKLYFVYKNDKGKIVRKKIDNSHFIAQEGYANPRIQKVGGVTAETEQQRLAREEFTSAEEIAKQKETLAKNRDARLEIVAELQQTAKEELEKVNQKLLSKTEQLQKIQEELDGLQEVKVAEARTKREKKIEEKYPELSRQKVRLSNVLSTTSKAVSRLASLKQSVEDEIANLTSQKEELELNLSYFEDFTQNLDELPENSGEFLKELKEQVGWLEELIKDTASNLSSLGRLSGDIDKTIKEFVKFLKDSIAAFDSKYPDYIKNGFDRIIASGTIVAEIPQIKEYIADYTLLEDTKQEITLNEDKIAKIREQMDGLQSQMKEIAGEYGAKKALLDRFQKVADEYVAKKKEEEKIFNNKQLIAKAVGTADTGVQTTAFEKKYEADSKKSNELLPRSTSPASGKPHHIRANFFGVKLNSFPNRNNIRGVYVTSKNEALILPGLMDHLRTSEDGVIDETINKDQIIALVMVEISEDGKTMTLVDQNGQPLAENADKINTAIYQVYPEAKLEWDAKWSKSGKPESMFRDTTPDDVREDIRKQYAAWRNKVLANEGLEVHEIDASFGNPQYVRDAEGQVITSTRTSVEDAGLIDAEQLETLPLITVGKTNDPLTSGSVSFKNPLGKVFLELPNGLAKLQNRNLTAKESENVFNAILQLSKNLLKKDGIDSDESVRLLNWLRSIVYWGIPTDQQGNRKPAGYNSVFWEQDPETGKLMLSISGKGMNFPFTPSSLEENREQIIAILNNLYNNINSSKVVKRDEPYEEILSISPAGEVSSRMWPNYQSYLLSNTTPDGKKRNNADLPLATQYRPVENVEDVNRDGVYFYTSDTADDFIIPVKTKVVAGPIRTLTPGAPKAAPQPTAPTPVTYTLDGKTVNIFTSPSGKKIRFAATANASTTNLDDIKILSGEDVQDVIDLMKSQGKDPKTEIQKVIFNAIAPTIDSIKAAEADEMEFVIGEDSPAVKEVESVTGESVSNDLLKDVNNALNNLDDEAMRLVVENELDRFEGENWTKVEKWLKENFPNIPVYRVKNIIKATNGAQAWGMFKDGAVYIYENAEIGTAYHEVFHAVWRMFTDSNERKSIVDEFKKRKGSYVERETGNTIKYSEATERQMEEKLAEEFRDYVHKGIIPAKPTQGRPFILKVFADLVNAIKSFFTGKKAQVNTANLFEKIGTGYYKTYSPITSSLSFARKGVINVEDAFGDANSVFSLVGITDKERSDIIQHMTYLTLTNLIKTDKSLFSIPNLNRTELYNELKSQVKDTILLKVAAANGLVKEGKRTQAEVDPVITSTLALVQNVDNQWDQIVARHEEYLRGYQIEFDENDSLQINDVDKIKESDFVDSTKVDNFKKSNTAIKLLMASLPLVDENNKLVRSSVGGAILLPVSRTYVSLLNNLHDANSVEEMMDRLRKMAESDPNYRNLYKRVTKLKDWTNPVIDLSNIKTAHGLELLGGFWKTFKKQNPEVVNVFIFENGDVAVGDANLSTAANQIKNEFINNIVIAAKGGKSYFKYDEKQKVFVGDSASLKGVTLNTTKDMVDFLAKMGISFTTKELNKLNKKQLKQFKTTVSFIKKGVSEGKRVATFSGKSLDMSNRLLELSIIKAAIENPEFDSTFFNISGERTQSYIGTNAAYDLYNFLSQLDKFDRDSLAGTQYEYLLDDSFAKNSNLLQRMFTSKGTRKEGSEELLRTGYVSGTANDQNGKRKESSKLNYKERLVQELNLNLAGYYLNLIPGDASLEWMMNMGNAISADSLASGFGQINDIFKGYFLSELELARDKKRPVAEGRKANEMRFFKDILGEDLHNAIMKDQASLDEVYARFENKINAAVKTFVETKTQEFQRTLESYGIVKDEMGKINVENVNLPKNMSAADFKRNLTALTVNFMINNIELHKLLYADPYQYSDELKRIKSFNSPRQALIYNSPQMDAAYNAVYNKGFKKGDVGWTNFTKGFFRTVVHEDIIGVIDLPDYEEFKETDGGGVISMKANRHFRIRANNWNENEEKQYLHDVEYEKLVKSGASAQEIAKFERNNPKVKSAYTPLKPIVSGNKANGQKFNDVVLDKFALYPLSFRIMHQINPESNSIKLYDKMQNEDIDYMVFESGRKVGTVDAHSTYNEDGTFNNTPYTKENITNVSFSIMSVQSDVPSKDTALVTRGSQVTKLITMDFMEAGVPVDFFPGKDFPTRFKAWDKLTPEQKLEKSEIYREIKNNQDLLQALMTEGYESTLKRLGITESKDKDGNYEYKVSNISEAVKTLRDEILKREVNDNISDALQGFLDGHAVLESTPAYQQIRNILYSIADKEIVSPKISGGMKVQIPSSLLESVRAKQTTINDKTGYTSEYLKFGKEDGKVVCEIMVGRWFKSDMSDKELLKYLNTTPEGQKILSGLAFRIPTQKQNSIDAFRIKQFLPEEFGDSVVIPAALVNKVGSDFDIDKLNVYFKNVYEDAKGNIKLIPFLGYGKEAKAKFTEMFDKGEFLTKEQLQEVDRIIEEEKDAIQRDASGKMMFEIFKDSFDQAVIEDFILSTTKKEFKEKFIDQMYKKSLENEYIQSTENLVKDERNYDRLIKPNSAEQLKTLGKFIAKKTVGSTFNYSDVGNMLDRNYMSRLRHAFVTGKYAIGIAAVNQTNHSLNQRQPIYVDYRRLSNLDPTDQFWLTDDPRVKFDKFNSIEIDGRMFPTLSMITNAERNEEFPNGQDISDIIGQFIDGYVDISKGPWIMELGATPNVASTWLFLAKIGVPIDTVAYFMNQPIIRDYLRTVESAGYSYLFIDQFVGDMQGVYESNLPIEDVKEYQKNFKIPSKDKLKTLVGKSVNEMNEYEKMDQQAMLTEFLKYAKMAEHMFTVTQGSNFDTATFNDPYLVFKKQQQLAKAQNTIISNVNDLLENSFIGQLGSTVQRVRNALAEILRSDQKVVRGVIQQVLMPYINMSDRDFTKLAQKAVNDMFDWAVQTNENLAADIKEIMMDDEGVMKEVMTFVKDVKTKPSHPLYNNHIINIIEAQPSKKLSKNSVNNLKIKGVDNRVYDQNNIIYAFRELRDYLNGRSDLYNRMKLLAVLQSGLSSSPISFTSLLPYEDFKDLYNKTLVKLETIPNLADFHNLGVFQRNNWNNDDIVPYKSASLIKSKSGKRHYNPGMKFLPEGVKMAVAGNEIPPVLSISQRNREANSEYMVYTWEKGDELLTDREKTLSTTEQINLIKAKKSNMRKDGDYSFINKGLFQKVKDDYGNPLVTKDFEGKPYFVYKAINAWGDSYRANEFYTVDTKSQIDNGFIKVEDVDNNLIINKFLSDKKAKGAEKVSVFENQAAMEERIAELEEKKKTTGIGPTEATLLQQLKDKLNKTKGGEIKPEGRPAIKDKNKNNC